VSNCCKLDGRACEAGCPLFAAGALGGVAADSLPWIEPVYECVPLVADVAAAPLVA
jgi:hypothetical protein